MAVGRADTFVTVAKTKRVSPAVLKTFGGVLKTWVDKEHAGNQTHAGKALGVSQSYVSAMLGGIRGPGLNTLILMRDQTGLTIEQMLGLAPPRRVSADEYLALLAELDAVRRQDAAPPTATGRKRTAR